MRNKYPGKCIRCKVFVPANTGYFEKVIKSDKSNLLHKDAKTKWVIRCKNCVGKGHEVINSNI